MGACVAALALSSVALAGCALDAGVRSALYRDTPAAPHPVGPGYQDASLFLAGRIVPARGRGATIGGEAEAALGAGAAHGSPRFEFRNVGMLIGYSWLPPSPAPPGSPVRREIGVELMGLLGIGQPAGVLHPGECLPAPCSGPRYHLGAAVNVVQPIVPFDTRSGFVVAGWMLDLVADARAGVWTPPAGDQRDYVLVEATLGLSLRLRVVSDLLSAYGYPSPTRYR